jgi:hypothetical protein
VSPQPVVQVPTVQAPPVAAPVPKRPKHNIEVNRVENRIPKQRVDDIDRPVTPQELHEADEELKLGEDTLQRIQKLREDIIQGRVKATGQRKKELGFLPESKVRITTPKKGIKIDTKQTKEQFEKYLETAKQLDEQKKKRLTETINDVMKGTEQ